jgi:hypothetical protein
MMYSAIALYSTKSNGLSNRAYVVRVVSLSAEFYFYRSIVYHNRCWPAKGKWTIYREQN